MVCLIVLRVIVCLVTNRIRPPFGEFPGGPVVRTRHFHCCSIPGQGTKTPQAAQHGEKKQINKIIDLRLYEAILLVV